MPRHRNLNFKKFVDSIPAPLMEEYFNEKVVLGSALFRPQFHDYFEVIDFFRG